MTDTLPTLADQIDRAEESTPEIWNNVRVFALNNGLISTEKAEHWREIIAWAFAVPDENLLIAVALSLVPEGWKLDQFRDCNTWWACQLWRQGINGWAVYVGFNDGKKPATGPLAIVAAALRAIEAEREGK